MSSPAAMPPRSADWRGDELVPEPRYASMKAGGSSEGLDFFGSQFGTPLPGETPGLHATEVDPVMAAKACINLDTRHGQAVHRREKYHRTVPGAKLAKGFSHLKIGQETNGSGSAEIVPWAVSADLSRNIEYQIPPPCPYNPKDAGTVASFGPSSFQVSGSRGDKIGFAQSPTAQPAKDKEASVGFDVSALHPLDKSSNPPCQNVGVAPEQHQSAPDRSRAGPSQPSGTPVSSQNVSLNAQRKGSHPSGSQNNRNGHHHDDHEKNGDQSNPPPPGTAPLESSTRQLFPCFFYMDNPVKFEKCGKLKLATVSAIKQHLERQHKKPDFYCPICCQKFYNDDERDTHIRSKSCKESPNRFRDNIKATIWPRIKVKRKKQTPATWWRDTFKLLFPDRHELPRLPHMDNATIDQQASSPTACEAADQNYHPNDGIDPRLPELDPNIPCEGFAMCGGPTAQPPLQLTSFMPRDYTKRNVLPQAVPPQDQPMSSLDDTKGDIMMCQGDPNDWCGISNPYDTSTSYEHLNPETQDALTPLSRQYGRQGGGGTAHSQYDELNDNDCDYVDDDEMCE